MSTPRRPAPRSRGTPITSTRRVISVPTFCTHASISGKPFQHLFRRRPSIGHAVGNANTAEPAPRDEETGVLKKRPLDGGKAIEVTDLVLCAGSLPTVN